MRRPPSPALLASYPVSGGVGLLATAVTAMTLTGKWSIDPFVMNPNAFRTQPWRLLTSALPHGDPLHLIFNVYWLWVFGTLLEEVLGHVRTLALVLLFAAVSEAAEYAVFEGGIGLSGVGFGLVGMLWILSSRDRRFAGAVDKRTAQLFAAWFVFCIVATRLHFMAIANVAHAAGAAMGLLVGLAMSARDLPRRVAAAIGVVAFSAASGIGATVLRRHVNLSHDGFGSFQLGFKALEDHRYADAIANYREAVAMNPHDAKAWNNLGIAYGRVGDLDHALDAARRAYGIDPTPDHRHGYFAAAYRVASAARAESDTARVEELAHEILGVDADQRRAWQLLLAVYETGGHDDELRKVKEALARLPP